MDRADGSYNFILFFQRIKIRCYNIFRGYASWIYSKLTWTYYLTVLKNNDCTIENLGLTNAVNKTNIIYKINEKVVQ